MFKIIAANYCDPDISISPEEVKVRIASAIKIYWWNATLCALVMVIPFLHLAFPVYISLEIVLIALLAVFTYILMLAFRAIAGTYRIPGLFWITTINFILTLALNIGDVIEAFFTYNPEITAPLTLLSGTALVYTSISFFVYAYFIGKLPSEFGSLSLRARVSNIGAGIGFGLVFLSEVYHSTNVLFNFFIAIVLLAGVVLWVATYVYDYKLLKRALDLANGFIQPNTAPSPAASETKLQGLKGWLIVVGFGLLLGMWSTGQTVYTDAVQLITPNNLLFDPASQSYIGGFGIFMKLEFFAYTALFLCAAYLTYCFFKTKKQFPVLYCFYLLFALLVVGSELVGSHFLRFSSLEQEQNVMAVFSSMQFPLIGAIIGTFIWIPYMIRSKRVKATFVK